jgi:hypothetical protein
MTDSFLVLYIANWPRREKIKGERKEIRKSNNKRVNQKSAKEACLSFFRFLIKPHVTEASGSGDIIPVTPYIGFRRR